MATASSIILNLLGAAGATMPVQTFGKIPDGALPRMQLAQVTVQQSIVVRIPVRPDAPTLKWVEKGSSRCVKVDEIAGAIVTSPAALDLILRGGERWRLKFRDECPALAFYRGFYLRPGEDRKICAKRDVIHPRSGGECEIQTFKKLKPEIDD